VSNTFAANSLSAAVALTNISLLQELRRSTFFGMR
jgi:adenosylmethionine-8-amino-7-oxononanoate aminotransferase